MGRRSDHSRAELDAMILHEGGQLMAENGFNAFSAREVAKRIGYSVGTVVNLFNGVDGLVVAINAETFRLWADHLERCLEGVNGPERITRLVKAYFDFASSNLNRWAAIYEHRLPADAQMPEALATERAALTRIVAREVAAVLPPSARDEAVQLSRSLIATVHGHCVFALNGSFALLGESDPLALAIARVVESLRAQGAVV
ncbi:MAG TPA: TetR/AcrR family transcriptional regulator [Sphingobium sp.]|uniref:TetR/AcrR family transcriptional regulator n=1 Tax=Sphingobium sp. TaxID=1912891 RepID=UPI002ED22492